MNLVRLLSLPVSVLLSGLVLLLVGPGLAAAEGNDAEKQMMALASSKKSTKVKEKPFPFPADTPSLKQMKEYRKTYTRLTALQKSALHWNFGIVTYINKGEDRFQHNYNMYVKEFEALDEDDDEALEEIEFKPYDVGTIIVKEQYPLESEHHIDIEGVPLNPSALSIMIKEKKGYDPENGDWRYLQITSSGTMVANGKASDPVVKPLCGECHINVKDRDYVYHTFFTKVMTKKKN